MDYVQTVLKGIFPIVNVSRYLYHVSNLFQNFDSALRCLNQSDSLEGASMRVQIYLSMHRVDLAKYVKYYNCVRASTFVSPPPP